MKIVTESPELSAELHVSKKPEAAVGPDMG